MTPPLVENALDKRPDDVQARTFYCISRCVCSKRRGTVLRIARCIALSSINFNEIEKVEIVFRDGVGYDSPRLIESVHGMVGLH
jgi:hypothetical protein